jgi:hypothetical protein
MRFLLLEPFFTAILADAKKEYKEAVDTAIAELSTEQSN